MSTFANIREMSLFQDLPSYLNMWHVLVALVVVLCLVIFLLRKIFKKKYNYVPYGNITDVNKIKHVIDLAVGQRAHADCQVVTADNAMRPAMQAVVHSFNNKEIRLELIGFYSLSQYWKGRSLQIFFRLNINGQAVFFTFLSHINEVLNLPQQVCQLSIAFPKNLENRQKRAFFRLNPPVDIILGAGLWIGPDAPREEYKFNINKWKAPSLLSIKGIVQEFKIVDISAGGVRICIPAGNKQYHYENSEEVNTIPVYLLLDLSDPEKGEALRIWASCKILNSWEDPIKGETILCLQYTEWGKAKTVFNALDLGCIEWRNLSKTQEIEGIGTWIMKRHLELHRDNALA